MTDKERRQLVKRKLGNLENIITRIFSVKPELTELKRLEDVIDLVHVVAPWYSIQSIDRIARKIRAEGRFDHQNNVEVRSNIQTAYSEYFKP